MWIGLNVYTRISSRMTKEERVRGEILRGENSRGEMIFTERTSLWRDSPRREELRGEPGLPSTRSHLYVTHSVGLLPLAVQFCICVIWLVCVFLCISRLWFDLTALLKEHGFFISWRWSQFRALWMPRPPTVCVKPGFATLHLSQSELVLLFTRLSLALSASAFSFKCFLSRHGPMPRLLAFYSSLLCVLTWHFWSVFLEFVLR